MSFQGDSIYWVEVEKIVPNPFQPRREFDEHKLKELAESVRMYGILQPLTVTRKEVQNEDGSFRTEYELIAGERRLRASKLAGLEQVPVIIREGEQSEQEKLELAIIENLQREDLNAVDRALAFRQLADVFGLPYAQVARKVGRSREYVSNTVRLLGLPDYMLNSLRTGDISEGHARTLLMLNERPEEQDTVFREILLKKLSVREVERIARSIAQEKVRKRETLDVELVEMEKQFTESLGTRVSIVKTEFGGRLTIDYFSPEDLEVLLARLRAEAAERQGTAIAPGSLKEDMQLLEDRDAREALEKIEASTGLESVTVSEEHHDPSEVTEVTSVTTVTATDTTPFPRDATPEAIPEAPATPVSEPPSTLRSQLASLVQQLKPPTPPVTPTIKPTPSAPAPITPIIPPTAQKTEAPAAPTEEDLYSVNKFTI